MTREALINEIRKLTDKQFVELFYEVVERRDIYPSQTSFESHLVLANAVRERESAAAWTVELICPTPGVAWVDDAPSCQHGTHCGMETASWGKNSRCPVCGGDVYGT